MAKNQPIGDGHRIGAVKNRTQVYNQTTDIWIKRGPDIVKPVVANLKALEERIIASLIS